MIMFQSKRVGSIYKFEHNGEIVIGQLLWFIKEDSGKILGCLLDKNKRSYFVNLDRCSLYRIQYSSSYYDVFNNKVPTDKIYT